VAAAYIAAVAAAAAVLDYSSYVAAVAVAVAVVDMPVAEIVVAVDCDRVLCTHYCSMIVVD
jgi:hypothetical protein